MALYLNLLQHEINQNTSALGCIFMVLNWIKFWAAIHNFQTEDIPVVKLLLEHFQKRIADLYRWSLVFFHNRSQSLNQLNNTHWISLHSHFDKKIISLQRWHQVFVSNDYIVKFTINESTYVLNFFFEERGNKSGCYGQFFLRIR